MKSTIRNLPACTDSYDYTRQVGNVTFPKAIPIKGIAGSPTTLTRVGEDRSPETAVAKEKLPYHRREHKAKLPSFGGQVGRRQKNPPAETP
jgi:hypothetical protein